MGAFDLDFSHICAVVEPDRLPLRGNEHRITRVAFDLFKLDNDKENLWQIQADDDGNEFLVRTYELPTDAAVKGASDWSVVEDGKKASLTVAYRGMPIHRLVASDYGARTAEEVGLLRDLVQAKLAEPEFAGRMLAAMPETKRAALATAFPKLAAQPQPAIPKIPQVSGKDPLEGLPPTDLKKEWGIDPKAKPKLPSWQQIEQHPQTADDPDVWRAQSLIKDMGRSENREEAKALVPQVMSYLEARPGKKISLQTLYTELECGDIPLYLALHALVKGGLVDGISPYDAPSAEAAALRGEEEMGHGDFFYSVGGPKLQNADEGGEDPQRQEPKEMGRLEEGFQHLQKMIKHREDTAIEKAVAIAKEMGHNGQFERHKLPMIVFYFHEGDTKAKEFLAKMDQAGYYGTLVGPGWAAVKLPGL